MILVVKKDNKVFKQFKLDGGPLHIGRHRESGLYLPERVVSRHHASLYRTEQGQWIIEDLNSANGTVVNGKRVGRAEVREGDVVGIGSFLLELEADRSVEAGDRERISAGDTLVTAKKEPQVISRRLDSGDDTPIHLPASRAGDFLKAVEMICRSDLPEEQVRAVVNVCLTQFEAEHCWCALRDEPEGPMRYEQGKTANFKTIFIGDLAMRERLPTATERGEFTLLPQVRGLSVMIAPIVGQRGCFGVIYIDRKAEPHCFSMSDLDYLMFLAIHTAAVVENF